MFHVFSSRFLIFCFLKAKVFFVCLYYHLNSISWGSEFLSDFFSIWECALSFFLRDRFSEFFYFGKHFVVFMRVRVSECILFLICTFLRVRVSECFMFLFWEQFIWIFLTVRVSECFIVLSEHFIVLMVRVTSNSSAVLKFIYFFSSSQLTFLYGAGFWILAQIEILQPCLQSLRLRLRPWPKLSRGLLKSIS